MINWINKLIYDVLASDMGRNNIKKAKASPSPVCKVNVKETHKTKRANVMQHF